MQATDIVPNSLHAGVEDLWGFSIRETGGAAAVVNLRTATVGGQLVFSIALAANESVNAIFPRTVTFNGDCYVEVASGAVAGSLIYNG